jgi:hypothetical protein
MIRRHGPGMGHPADCFGCKVLTVQIGPANFQPHWNYAVGAWVTNQADFENKLKRLADRQSERTGIDATFEPIHPADLKASPPPEAPPTHLPRLTDIDDPTMAEHIAYRNRVRADQRARALLEAETTDLTEEED